MDFKLRIEVEVYFDPDKVVDWFELFTFPDDRHNLIDSLPY